MSTSLLYHAFGIRGYQYVHTDYAEGVVVFPISRTPNLPLLGLRLARRRRAGRSNAASAPCPSAAAPGPLCCPSRAS